MEVPLPRLLALVAAALLLAFPPALGQSPSSRAMDTAPWGATAASCPAPCYAETPADASRVPLLVLLFDHDRDAQGRGSQSFDGQSQQEDALVLPFLTTMLNLSSSDRQWSARNDTSASKSNSSHRGGLLNASTLGGFLVVGGARSYSASDSQRGSDREASESDMTYLSDAGYFLGMGSRGSVLLHRERSIDDGEDKTTEKAGASRETQVGNQRTKHDVATTLESDHRRGTATLRVNGEVAGYRLDTRQPLPVALP